MDFQNRAGHKHGGGDVASFSHYERDRKERLRRLALETIDLAKDPYLLKNHQGSYDCKLCQTHHLNEASYLAHTQGKKHQTNLGRRAARDAYDAQRSHEAGGARGGGSARPGAHAAAAAAVPKRAFTPIGLPGYRIVKIADPDTPLRLGLRFEIAYPEITRFPPPAVADAEAMSRPFFRFMSAYEQRVEPPQKAFQYVLFAAEPYDTLCVKIPSREVDLAGDAFFEYWDPDAKVYYLQFLYKEPLSLQEERNLPEA
ncbi:hypothetical protein CXG81DRAFT_29882 [Caulochytrium protostelioides]|uniref:Matrin-type domain-containing protein n=1 Tax=Caulochytrium protostelioides TaxID=1555241 RepID=A0A4V1IUK3_9FUNG|nr:hypothetical protein CXG81DRAFT_29882 [Caulochytrium protostelioides]|eukprot:RKP00859.1 hypothetical protein CXG81DRAFT_29882 [Caulochytrium protostelioides]